jgi:5-methylcytosine-specific restriction endonuclease McrA
MAHRWYDKRRWKRMARIQLQQHPFCKMCLQQGKIVLASVVDHVIPHKGDHQAFWFGELQSLCRRCHDGRERQLEKQGFYTDIDITD